MFKNRKKTRETVEDTPVQKSPEAAETPAALETACKLAEEKKKPERSNPIVSILIPICNVAKYLPKCLDSVIAQTMEEIEIICINDGSTDNSLDIIQEYAAKDSRIRVIDKENSGYGDSMNRGLAAATGDYIGIVESDDFIVKDMFASLYNLSFDGTVDVVKGNFWDYYEDGEKLPTATPNRDRANIPDSEEPFTLKENGQFSWGHPSVWSAIYRRQFLVDHDIHFIAAKGGGWVDNPFYYETLCSAERIMWTNEPFYYYRKTNPTSSSNLQKDPSLPFIRMLDNFNVVEQHHIQDIDTLKCTYARALMYYTGALKDFDYDANAKKINDYAAELMKHFDVDIFTSQFNLADQQKYYSALSPLKNIRLTGPRVLIYNWVPYDNPGNVGGGVTVYCRNLIHQILRENPEVTVYMLSSGWAYDATSLETYIRKISSQDVNVHQYEIVNSPVPAEQSNLFVNPSVAIENAALKETFRTFIKRYGPFDAIHFNNIEGLSLNVMELKQDYPDTRFIFSIHNYVPMCVHGFYYMRHKHCNCNPNHTGEDCMQCTRMNMRRNIADATYDRGLFNNDPKKCYSKTKWVKTFGMEQLDVETDAEHILDFSKAAIRQINQNCDEILAVSKRVYEIAEDNGFDASKMKVSYIGTKVAAHQLGHAAYPVKNGLKIVFLGNDINYEEKGYPFLIEALSKLELKYAAKIDLVFTVRQKEHADLYTMLNKFHSVKVYVGYTHNDLPRIFKGCNLSLVPVLWEDNLPQIAIESVAYGIPVLASSAGGPSELTDSALFRFQAGDAEDLLAKIRHFADHPEDLDEYWKHHHGLVTMEQHWAEIQKVYGLDQKQDSVEIPMEDFRNLLKENDFLLTYMPSNGNGNRIPQQKVISDLEKKLQAANERNEELETELNELEKNKKYAGKVIFKSEYDPIQGDAGATLFTLTLGDFPYSDVYAEIRFVRLNNLGAAVSDTLKIAATWHNETGAYKMHIHQAEWVNNTPGIADMIMVYTEEHTIGFFGKYPGMHCGYSYEVVFMDTRAVGDTVTFAAEKEGFLFENQPCPNGAAIPAQVQKV